MVIVVDSISFQLPITQLPISGGHELRWEVDELVVGDWSGGVDSGLGEKDLRRVSDDHVVCVEGATDFEVVEGAVEARVFYFLGFGCSAQLEYDN